MMSATSAVGEFPATAPNRFGDAGGPRIESLLTEYGPTS